MHRKNIILHYLSSLKFASIIILIIIIFTIIGSIIPQNETSAFYQKNFSNYADMIIKFKFNDIYHSFYYRGLLIILSISLIVCLTNKLKELKRVFAFNLFYKGTVKQILSTIEPQKIKRTNINKQQIIDILKKHRYSIKATERENKDIILARKGFIERIGPILFHFSILIILIGGLITSFFGFNKHININEGETVYFKEGDFSLRLNKFKVEWYEDNSTPKEFISDLTVIDKGKEVLRKKIEVNHPLKYKNLKFYQSSYGQLPNPNYFYLNIIKDNKVIKNLQIPLNKEFVIAKNIKGKILTFFSDFVINEGRPMNRSYQMNNPAILIQINNNGNIFKFWNFYYHGVFHKPENFNYDIKFAGAESGYYSGLQYAYDPGYAFVFSGFVLMMLGISCGLYFYFHWIWIIIDKKYIIIGGRARKFNYTFNQQLNNLINEIKGVNTNA